MTKFDAWLQNSMPGDSFTYFEGFPLRDTPGVRAARFAFNTGTVDLVQKRSEHARRANGVGTFEYIAIRKRKPGRPMPHMLFPEVML